MRKHLNAFMVIAWLTGVLAAGADEKLAVLKVGDEVYRNVTITGTNATDIYFTHAGGIGNAKLKKLEPELQKRFQFDAAKAAETEKSQREANAAFRQHALTNRPVQAVEDKSLPPPTYDNGDVVAPKLHARSFRGQRPPAITVEKWFTPPPEKKDIETKCVLFVFWMSWAEPCRKAVPRLNELADKYRDRLVVIALSNETPEEMRKHPALTISFHGGTDPQARTMSAFEVTAVPHLVLADPKGIVRYEGRLGYLDNEAVEHLLTRYSK